MDFLSLIITNKIVLSCFAAMAIAQSIKSFLAWKKNGHFHWRYIFVAAGMPSSHTATVTALSFSLYLTEGVTNLFIAASVLGLIVIRDVIGDKAFAQQQEDMVNDIVHKITQGEFEKIEWNILIGHTLKEVFAGFFLGVAVSLIIFNI